VEVSTEEFPAISPREKRFTSRPCTSKILIWHDPMELEFKLRCRVSSAGFGKTLKVGLDNVELDKLC
jgi:hypothetical protein